MIRLPHGYYITSDTACYTLWRTSTEINKHTGKLKRNAAIGQYLTLEAALYAYADAVDRNVLNNGNMDISEAVKLIRETRAETVAEIKRIFAEGKNERDSR